MAERNIEDWSGKTGDRWLANIESFEGMLGMLHERLAATIAPQTGDTILDVGCGGGPLAVRLAKAVGPQGQVTGLDVAPQLIQLARQRAQTLGLTNLSFEVGDAATTTPPGAPFDRLVSAFGVMFFDDTQTAFNHLHGLVKEGARLDMLTWASPEKNPWMGLVMGTMGQFVDLPERDLEGPGPFRLCDPQSTIAMLEKAGFSNVAVEEFEQAQPLGGPGAAVADAVDFVMGALDVGAMMDEQGADKEAAEAELARVLQPFASAEGVMLPGCSLHYSGVA